MSILGRTAALLVLAAVIAAVVVFKDRKERPNGPGNADAAGIEAPADSTAGEQQERPLPRLVDLGAGKCIPCKAMAPILKELKTTCAGTMDVAFIDVWENEGAGEKYGIKMIPTQIFFAADGRELFRHEGFMSREDIVAKWLEHDVIVPDPPVGVE